MVATGARENILTIVSQVGGWGAAIAATLIAVLNVFQFDVDIVAITRNA